nr:hypothetical protein [Sphingomonas melonis]
MPTIPVRGLGSAGIVTDAHPSDIEDLGTFTAGVNVRFRNGRVSRGAVARTVHTLGFEPGHVLAVPPTSGGYDEIIMVAADFGKMYRKNGETLEDVTPADQVAGATIARPSPAPTWAASPTSPARPTRRSPRRRGTARIPRWPTGPMATGRRSSAPTRTSSSRSA